VGQPLDPQLFAQNLKDTEKQIKAVVITHMKRRRALNDLETINRHVKAHGEALIIDAVTSLGAVNLR